MATHVEYSIPKNNVTVVVSEPGKKNQDPPIADNPVQRQDGSPGNDSTMRSQQAQGKIPGLFERSSKKWWNPQMDTKILEEQCLECSLDQSISYFRKGLFFILLACVLWIIYFAVRNNAYWIAGIIWSCALTLLCLITFVLTKRKSIYKRFSCYIAVGIIFILMVTACFAAYFQNSIMTIVGSFFLAMEIILLLYTVMPLPLHVNFIFGGTFSILFEVIYHVSAIQSPDKYTIVWLDIISHILLHICVHLLGVQICLNLQVRRRSTFWKVGQIIQSSKSVEVEADFKKVMIDSIMPPSISEKLVNENNSIFQSTARQDGRFRPLYVDRMENVSILYADIVGFTKMSANKSAATLVRLLNDLFGRFDTLCIRSGCEKISTLGDCYYCVAGCPVYRDDHAKCCVEMGLGMIAAIKDFCTDNDLNVDMRIGIHTGIVICGIIGRKRFKFDVWSNDVTFANQMEQWGVPGRIHISEPTKACLGDEYEYEDAKIEERAPKEIVEKGIKTYLIINNIESESSSVSEETEELTQDQMAEGNTQASPQDEKNISSNGFGTDNQKNSQTADKDHSTPEKARVKKKNKVDVVQENLAGPDKTAENGTSELENAMAADPLLPGKRTSRRVRSTREKSKKQRSSELEPKMKQNQILELIGLHGMLPMLNFGQSVRMEQDREFVNTIKNDERMKNIYKNKSLETISMRFKEEDIEEAYRNKFRSEVKNHEPIMSFVSARLSYFFDLLISFFVFILVFISSVLMFRPQTDNVAWIVFFCIVFTLELLIVCVSGSYVFNLENASAWVKDLIISYSGWIPRHILGACMLTFPAGVVLSNIWCRDYLPNQSLPPCAYYLILGSIALIHFLNYNQLSSWIRSVIACLVSITITVLVYVNPCQQITIIVENGTYNQTGLCNQQDEGYEYILDVVLLMVFIFVVNQEYEVGHRLTYYSAHEAEKKNSANEIARNQINDLLHDIIPPRVTEVIREKRTYSQNHENVGVIFGSIINFNEFYEEAFAGGKECIRVLNELIGDVDELLDLPEFADIEKIKTIGSTFMIASGLNPNIPRDPDNPHSHLCVLMDFSMKMQDVIYEFNENMVYFTFILRIGFNHGSITAGVIGTTKLLYDIWGDTVNIASRMDSTGEPRKIQVSEGSKKVLENFYDFKYRGKIFVKGKGDMDTYLLNRRDDEDRPVLPNPEPTPKIFPGQTS